MNEKKDAAWGYCSLDVKEVGSEIRKRLDRKHCGSKCETLQAFRGPLKTVCIYQWQDLVFCKLFIQMGFAHLTKC